MNRTARWLCFGSVVMFLFVVALGCGAETPEKVRPAVGLGDLGGWFPESRDALKTAVDKSLAGAGEVKVDTRPVAIIAPHAGYAYSAPTAGFAYKALAGRAYDRIIIMGPNHYPPAFDGAHIGDFDAWVTPLGLVQVDKDACAKLFATGVIQKQTGPDPREHSIQNQLPFLQTVLPGVKIVPIVVGGGQTDETIRKLGEAVRSIMTPDTLVVVSSDFTHYGRRFDYAPYSGNLKENIRKGDEGAIDFIVANDFKDFRAYMDRANAPTICGADPIAVMLSAIADRKDVKGKLLSYANSAEVTGSGDYSASVSYAAIVLISSTAAAADAGVTGKLALDDQKTLLAMAREQVVKVVKEGKAVDPKDYKWNITPAITASGAAFVTLTNHGRLRGCIGDILPAGPLYKSVLGNAINAARRDYRFFDDPITAKELPDIEVEITVLTKPVDIASYKDIVIGKHGVLMECRGHRAVFLPQVAVEQKWDLDTMLMELSLKAGLNADAYKSPAAKFQVFEGQVFNEAGVKGK